MDRDFARLLRVGWRHYCAPPAPRDEEEPTNAKLVAKGTEPDAAEAFEVYDKGGAGYVDGDSVLQGSAVQRSSAGGSGTRDGGCHSEAIVSVPAPRSTQGEKKTTI